MRWHKQLACVSVCTVCVPATKDACYTCSVLLLLVWRGFELWGVKAERQL